MPNPETIVPRPIASQCHTLCHRKGSASATRKMIPAVAANTSASVPFSLPRFASAKTANKKKPKRRNRGCQVQQCRQRHEINPQRNPDPHFRKKAVLNHRASASNRYAERKITETPRSEGP